MTSESLLDGLRVLDLAGEPAQMAARILGDLGADVTRVACAGAGRAVDRVAWDAGKRLVTVAPDDDALDQLLANADVVIDTPGWPGTLDLDPAGAPDAVWVSVTPFGRRGPRASWRASDLGVMASTGNMYSTGDADRAPVRCTEPSAYAHTGPEAAFAALTGVASGRPQCVDVSMQEVVLVASMGAAGRFARTGFRGKRSGSAVGRTREIWPCADGFVSFGLRGGKARVPNLRLITRLLAIIPAVLIIGIRGDSSVNDLLTLSQVVLALQLPFAMFPLLHFTSSRNKMGTWKLGWFLLIAGWGSGLLIAAMDIWGLPDSLKTAWHVIVGG